MISVFTPTYNRSYSLPKLFQSLQTQSNKNFEWIIVDDGSTDDTQDLIKSFIQVANFNIIYIKQNNGGKHRAINQGVLNANGELFFIVDSDDYLTENAIEFLAKEWEPLQNNCDFVGISGYRINPSGDKIGEEIPSYIYDCSYTDLRFKMRIKGDMAEAWKTNILKENPFQEFQNEKFIAESSLWIKISNKKKIRYTLEPIYICEYLNDGLTKSNLKLRYSNPNGCLYYYSHEAKLNIPSFYKIKSYINFWRFSKNSHISFLKKIKMCGVISLIGLVPGLILRFKDNIQIKHDLKLMTLFI